MKRPTPRELRKLRDVTEVAEFTPSTHIETLRDRMDTGVFSATGWTPPRNLSADSWRRMGATLQGIESALPWWWADWWLARGSRGLPDDWTGPDLRTLDNYAIVARAYPFARRRANVSFKHHAELTSLPEVEQDELLDWCAPPAKRSVAALREEKRRRLAPKLPPPNPAPIDPPPKVGVVSPSPKAVVAKVTLVQPLPERLPAELELPPSDDVLIPIMLHVAADLHAWAREAATGEDMPLSVWIIRLIERARDG